VLQRNIFARAGPENKKITLELGSHAALSQLAA
jgi:hypothetical protein